MFAHSHYYLSYFTAFKRKVCAYERRAIVLDAATRSTSSVNNVGWIVRAKLAVLLYFDGRLQFFYFSIFPHHPVSFSPDRVLHAISFIDSKSQHE